MTLIIASTYAHVEMTLHLAKVHGNLQTHLAKAGPVGFCCMSRF